MKLTLEEALERAFDSIPTEELDDGVEFVRKIRATGDGRVGVQKEDRSLVDAQVSNPMDLTIFTIQRDEWADYGLELDGAVQLGFELSDDRIVWTPILSE